ncbi:helix-turn-helix transcriptional regulator [Spongiactinospora sp. TRM90649]|uniref:helix-turn-helix domain-containing protein n=1 Tax=Spongiactinospora sp. TRM90649 TaxID=3031114 RepID=UPI0023F8E0FD|nr:helix-turn-helix transcriptional regulator [Spongiactinospora sp. TRM90649]MDF5754896.1 helix-turn-helix transcriptional regulator [Spongiactinospora sp. TRM90649]
MPERGSPTVRRRRLGQELRRLRENAGMTGDQVAERLSWSASKVSRMETAKTMPRRADVQALTSLYGADEAKQHELLGLLRDAARKGWWEDFSDSLPDELTTLLGLEADAVFARNWEPQIVPGLLQTEEYAYEVIRATQPITRIPPGEVRTRIEARMARQQLILRAEEPLVLWVVLDESVLLRRFGAVSVMRRQLERLIEVSRMPNIRVQILPLDAGHPVNTSSFFHLRFPEFHDVVYLESLYSARFVEDEGLVYGYEIAFDHLRTEAAGVDASRELIEKRIERWK